MCLASAVQKQVFSDLNFCEKKKKMGGKGVSSVISVVLILILVVAQNQIEAKSCCRNTQGRTCYNSCRITGSSQSICARLCDCIHVNSGRCPGTHPRISTNQNSEDVTEEADSVQVASNLNCPTEEALGCFKICRAHPALCAARCGCTLTSGDISDYCKLGCASTMCSTINISDIGEEEAVKRCSNACSEFCTKGSKIAMVTVS